jgi:hypothetical protein
MKNTETINFGDLFKYDGHLLKYLGFSIDNAHAFQIVPINDKQKTATLYFTKERIKNNFVKLK